MAKKVIGASLILILAIVASLTSNQTVVQWSREVGGAALALILFFLIDRLEEA